MKYHLHRSGKSLTIWSIEKLRRKRRSGELDGTERVWRAGMVDWLPLDEVLSGEPPSLPGAGGWSGRPWIIGAVVLSVLAMVVGGVVAVRSVISEIRSHVQALETEHFSMDAEGIELAGPVIVAPETRTAADLAPAAREFRARHYVEGYKRFGRRDSPCDAESVQFLEAWVTHYFGGEKIADAPTFEELGNRIAHRVECDDPLVLAIIGMHRPTVPERIRLLERALQSFEGTDYAPYTRFWVAVSLTGYVPRDSGRVATLDAAAVGFMQQALDDGSLRPEDQEWLAENLLYGWANDFFKRQTTEMCAVAADAGPRFAWLALVLDGESHIIQGWRARGGGFAHTVSEDGWSLFREHMTDAERSFTKAWDVNPRSALVASRMQSVALGQSDPAEIRRWFERAVTIQIDYPEAWSGLRWALRPRWYGSHAAMLKFGITAVDTGRFDTDVPRMLFDSITELEQELKVPEGEHIYERGDIWPHLRRMYEGYIAEPSQRESRDGWRSAYAAVAFIAGKYDIARTQLEAVDWKLSPQALTTWKRDFSLMPHEVAARTGSHGAVVSKAEAARERKDRVAALALYETIPLDEVDERTREFVERRVAALR